MVSLRPQHQAFASGPAQQRRFALWALGRRDLVTAVYEEAGDWEWARLAPAHAVSLDHFRGRLALSLGLTNEAKAHFQRGLSWALHEGSTVNSSACWMGLADALAASGQHGDEQESLRNAVDHARATGLRLHTRRAQRRWEEYRERSVDTTEPTTVASVLSAREIEVLRLVAAGRTNHEIAVALTISPNTVASHVAHIFNKTGAANRAEAASFGHRNAIL